MRRKFLDFLFLSCGFLFVPVTLFVTRLITGEAFGGLLTSSSIVIIYYIPLLAIISAFHPHFAPRVAIWPFFGILVLELLAFIPGMDPLDLLGRLLNSFYPNANPAVLGKSALLLIGAGIGAVSLLHRITLFRLISTFVAFAQCAAVVLFHVVAISWPFEGINQAERALVVSAIEVDGSMARLCGLSGRDCVRGTLDNARDWTISKINTPEQALSLINDTQDRARLFYSWVENPSPAAMTEVAVVSVLKHGADDIEIMISRTEPTVIYAKLRTSVGLLIAIFHAVWIAIELATLARHGNYAFHKWRWRRAA